MEKLRVRVQPTGIMYLDNTSTFGCAITSLEYLVAELDASRFVPFVVSAQDTRVLERAFPNARTIQMVPRLRCVERRLRAGSNPVAPSPSNPARRLLTTAHALHWVARYDLAQAARYAKVAREAGAGLLHLNNNVESQPSGALAAWLAGLPSVAHARSFQEPFLSLRIYLRLVDHHIAVSNAVRDNLLELGVAPDRISVVPDAVPVDLLAERSDPADLEREFDARPDEIRFGFFGRIVAWKGVLEFLHAAFEVMREEPRARAFIVGGVSDGDESYMRAVESQIMTSGFSDRIEVTGFRADVQRLMGFMDIVVHSSTAPEPFGMVLIEAMAARKPVVATRAGGPQDIVDDGETGYLVAPGSKDEMSAAILELIRDPGRARAMGEAGFARARARFGSDRSCRQVMDIYDRLLNGRGGRRRP